MTDEREVVGTVEAKTCGCCGHHELGIRGPSGEWIPLRPGDKIGLHRKEGIEEDPMVPSGDGAES